MAGLGSFFARNAVKASGVLLAACFAAAPCWPADQTVVNGAGGSFPAPIYTRWLDAYKKAHPDVQLNYHAVGSGGGIRQILEGTVDFGASDGPLTDKQLQGYKDSHGFGILHLPMVLGAAVPAYNLPGGPEINFTAEVLAGIYLGKITKWDDPQIRDANPKANLPSNVIVVLHRSEGSGTTYVWSDYLSKVSDSWKSRAGTGFSINWPVGLSARGNDGVADLIARTQYSLGYVELSYAIQKKLTYGKVRNSSGNFVKADLASVAAAAESSTNVSEDFRFSITNAPGKDAFPIASFSWLLVPAKIEDAGKRKAIVGFLNWALSDGQGLTQDLVYARVPARIVSKELAAISRIQ
ncbi:MAG TPA: phosphate ABC transporter substrate-binding protein PstS [Bryobacteraceae bacterium]|nr:phosphate ABC transporter substrate-binding protein PstS [Bryobacteraceae bacterium]